MLEAEAAAVPGSLASAEEASSAAGVADLQPLLGGSAAAPSGRPDVTLTPVKLEQEDDEAAKGALNQLEADVRDIQRQLQFQATRLSAVAHAVSSLRKSNK